MAASVPPKPRLAAVDTSVLLDLAGDREHAWAALETVCRRLPDVQIVVTPTVVQELAHLAGHSRTTRERNLALMAARSLVREWKFVPLSFIPVEHGITERIATALRQRGLLPSEEVNDSLILAESALAGLSRHNWRSVARKSAGGSSPVAACSAPTLPGYFCRKKAHQARHAGENRHRAYRRDEGLFAGESRFQLISMER